MEKGWLRWSPIKWSRLPGQKLGLREKLAGEQEDLAYRK
jgi:hypothetical protein